MHSRERVGAGRHEHIALPAHQLGDRSLVQFQLGHQLRELVSEMGNLLLAEHRRRTALAQQVALGLFHDLLDRVLLGRRHGGQIVIALDGRGVVGVDGGTAAAEPRTAVAMRLEGRADHVAVQANHVAIRIDHTLIVDPLGQGGSVGAAGPPGTSPVGTGGGGLEPQPQPLAQLGRAVLTQQGGVLEPALQQPHGLLRQGQAFVRGAALEVFQQDGGLPGPLQILNAQVVDAVGHDPGVDAEQQLVGEHHPRPGEQSLSLGVHGTDPVSRLVTRPADPCP